MRALFSLQFSLLVLLVPVVPLQDPVRYQAPVVAAVSDPFRPPASPYGAGNRGLEYATPPGTDVRAAAGGEVTFAGAVAGARWVTLVHGDGVRTTYGPLTRVDVVRSEAVAGGAVVGATVGRLLWTARIGDAYVDPAVLLAASGTAPSVRLVAGPGEEATPRRAVVSACAAAWAFRRPC